MTKGRDSGETSIGMVPLSCGSGWEEARRRFRAPATDRVRLAMRSKLTQTAGCGRLRPNLTAYLVGHAGALVLAQRGQPKLTMRSS